MINSVSFRSDHSPKVELPAPRELDSATFLKLVSIRSERDLNKYIYASSVGHSEKVAGHELRKFVCPSCSFPSVDKKVSKIVNCAGCGRNFMPVQKRVNLDEVLAEMKRNKCKAYQMNKFKRLQLGDDKLDRVTKSLAEYRYSILVDDHFIVPPFAFYHNNRYCLHQLKKSLSAQLSQKRAGSDKVSVIMPLKVAAPAPKTAPASESASTVPTTAAAARSTAKRGRSAAKQLESEGGRSTTATADPAPKRARVAARRSDDKEDSHAAGAEADCSDLPATSAPPPAFKRANAARPGRSAGRSARRGGAVPLYARFMYGNLDDRYKNGNRNFFRQHVLAKRISYTARSVIVPVPTLSANETVLSKNLGAILHWPKYVLLIRYPSLDFQNITFHKVVGYWDQRVIGIPISITKRNGADFDGDEMECIGLYDWKVISECDALLNPENNLASLQKLKISFGQDMSAACRGFLRSGVKTVEKMLYQYYCAEGSKKCYDLFRDLEKDLCRRLWEGVGIGINAGDLLSMSGGGYSDEYPEFDSKLKRESKPTLMWFTEDGSGYETGHLFQMVKKVGFQRLSHCCNPCIENKDVRGNFLFGLGKKEFLLHCQASRDALIDSNFGISVEGYNLFKMCFCTKDLVVHYDGSVKTCGKQPKLVCRKFQHLISGPDDSVNSERLPDALVHLICDRLETEEDENRRRKIAGEEGN